MALGHGEEGPGGQCWGVGEDDAGEGDAWCRREARGLRGLGEALPLSGLQQDGDNVSAYPTGLMRGFKNPFLSLVPGTAERSGGCT